MRQYAKDMTSEHSEEFFPEPIWTQVASPLRIDASVCDVRKIPTPGVCTTVFKILRVMGET